MPDETCPVGQAMDEMVEQIRARRAPGKYDDHAGSATLTGEDRSIIERFRDTVAGRDRFHDDAA